MVCDRNAIYRTGEYTEHAKNFLNRGRTGLEEKKEACASANMGSNRAKGDASQSESALFLDIP